MDAGGSYRRGREVFTELLRGRGCMWQAVERGDASGNIPLEGGGGGGGEGVYLWQVVKWKKKCLGQHLKQMHIRTI